MKLFFVWLGSFALPIVLSISSVMPMQAQSAPCVDSLLVSAFEKLATELVIAQMKCDRLHEVQEHITGSDSVTVRMLNHNWQSLFVDREFIAQYSVDVSGDSANCVIVYRFYYASEMPPSEYILALSSEGRIFLVKGFSKDEMFPLLHFLFKKIDSDESIRRTVETINNVLNVGLEVMHIDRHQEQEEVIVHMRLVESEACWSMVIDSGKVVDLYSCHVQDFESNK